MDDDKSYTIFFSRTRTSAVLWTEQLPDHANLHLGQKGRMIWHENQMEYDSQLVYIGDDKAADELKNQLDQCKKKGSLKELFKQLNLPVVENYSGFIVTMARKKKTIKQRAKATKAAKTETMEKKMVAPQRRSQSSKKDVVQKGKNVKKETKSRRSAARVTTTAQEDSEEEDEEEDETEKKLQGSNEKKETKSRGSTSRIVATTAHEEREEEDDEEEKKEKKKKDEKKRKEGQRKKIKEEEEKNEKKKKDEKKRKEGQRKKIKDEEEKNEKNEKKKKMKKMTKKEEKKKEKKLDNWEENFNKLCRERMEKERKEAEEKKKKREMEDKEWRDRWEKQKKEQEEKENEWFRESMEQDKAEHEFRMMCREQLRTNPPDPRGIRSGGRERMVFRSPSPAQQRREHALLTQQHYNYDTGNFESVKHEEEEEMEDPARAQGLEEYDDMELMDGLEESEEREDREEREVTLDGADERDDNGEGRDNQRGLEGHERSLSPLPRHSSTSYVDDNYACYMPRQSRPHRRSPSPTMSHRGSPPYSPLGADYGEYWRRRVADNEARGGRGRFGPEDCAFGRESPVYGGREVEEQSDAGEGEDEMEISEMDHFQDARDMAQQSDEEEDIIDGVPLGEEESAVAKLRVEEGEKRINAMFARRAEERREWNRREEEKERRETERKEMEEKERRKKEEKEKKEKERAAKIPVVNIADSDQDEDSDVIFVEMKKGEMTRRKDGEKGMKRTKEHFNIDQERAIKKRRVMDDLEREPERSERSREAHSGGIRRYTIFVGDLSTRTTKDDLAHFMGRVGHLYDVRLIPGNGRRRPFAFCDYASYAAASMAISTLNNCELMGRIVTVNWDKRR